MALPLFIRSLIHRGLLATRRKPPANEPVYPCGIFKYDRIGDFVLALGAIRTLTQAYGEERCVLIVSTLVEAWARRLFPAARIVALPLPGPGLLRHFAPLYLRSRGLLASVQCDRLVCLRHQRTAAYQVLLGSLHSRESFGVENDPRFLSPAEALGLPSPVRQLVPYPASAPARLCREIEAHRLVVEQCLGRPVAPEEVTPVLPVPGGACSGALVFCPFSSHVSKDFPEPAWLEVFATLSWKGPVELCGAPTDAARLEQFAAMLRAKGWTARVEATAGLEGLIATLASARAVLGVDSAPAHFATALDRPGVFLIGGGHWGMFAPWQRSARQVWLTHELPCFHCDWKCPYPTFRCITEIPPAQIAAALDTVLRDPAS